MQLRTQSKPLALDVAARAFIRHLRARRAARDIGARYEARYDASFASDPGDPVQGFDEVSELQGTPLEVDVQSIDDAETAQDLAELESEVDEIAGDDDAALAMVDLAMPDVEGLRGGGMPATRDARGGTDDDDEDEDRAPGPSHTRDTPIADLGSGGRRGQ
jgi:hypothetical protein